MTESKAWNWREEKNTYWLTPSEDSYYLANRWKEKGYEKLLDFGCGLGRHAVFFAKQGFQVSAFDLSEEGVGHLEQWAKREGLQIRLHTADMLNLPYEDASFDCIFAYHVISHTDTQGMKTILQQIRRILKPGGEIYLTLCSKDTGSFQNPAYPHIDENTVIKTEEGPEKGIPHFYVTLADVLTLMGEFQIETIRHIDDCYFDGKEQNSKHYFILAKK